MPQDWLSGAIDRVGSRTSDAEMQATTAFRAFDSQRFKAEEAARANDLARWSGLPADTVQRNLPQVEASRERDRAKDVIRRAPKMQPWLADPRNARVAVGDIDALGAASMWFGDANPEIGEVATRGAPRPSWARDTGFTPRSPEQIVRELKGSASWDAANQAAIERSRPGASAGSLWTGAAIDTVEGFKQSYYGAAMYMADAIGATNLIDNYQDSYFKSQDRALGNRPVIESATGQAVYGGVTSLAQTVPALAVGALTGGVGVLPLLGVQTGASAYGKYRSRGATANEALLGSVLEGGIEVATEKLPTDFLFSRFGKGGMAGFVTGYLGREMLGEQLATLGQDAVDTAIANPGKTWGDFLAERPRAAFDTAVGTLVATGAIGGASAVYRTLRKADKDLQDGTAAIAGAKFLDQAVGLAEASKLRKSDPQGFREYIQSHADGSPVESVYVPAEAARSLFQSEGIDYRSDPFWSSYAAQIDEAAAIGGDVVIPVGAAVVGMAESGKWDTFRDIMRLSPGGMSLAEARSIEESYAATMEQRGADVVAFERQAREAQAPAQRVYDSVLSSARQAGMSVNAAQSYAEVFSSRYAARAAARGVDALTLFNESLAGIQTELPTNLRPYSATDSVDQLVAVMRRDKSAPTEMALRGPSLLEWIAARGGVSDPGGDLASMGANAWHAAKPFRKRLIAASGDRGQASMLAPEVNPTSPDVVLQDAISAGYFPQLESSGELVGGIDPGTYATAADVSTLFDAIDAELRGTPTYSADNAATAQTEADAAIRGAAEDLRGFLESRGIDPDTAPIEDIRSAMAEVSASDARSMFEQASDRVFYQTQPNHPPFYSALRQTVASAKLAKASATQWKGTILNAPGVKAEEVEWSGLIEWLDEQPGQISRTDIEQFLAGGGIVVSEVVLGDANPRAVAVETERLYDEAVRQRAYASLDEADAFDGPQPPDIVEVFDDYEGEGPVAWAFDGVEYDTEIEAETAQADEAQRLQQEWEADRLAEQEDFWRARTDEEDFVDQAKRNLGVVTQFADYTVNEQASETYRELLITLPLGSGTNPRTAPDTHWDTPAVVAHVRFQTLRDAEGRPALFLEEVQSDWHQKGRDKGYAGGGLTAADQKFWADSLAGARADEETAQRAILALGRAQDVLPPDDPGFILADQPLDEQASYARVGLGRLMRGERSYDRDVGERPFDLALKAEVERLTEDYRSTGNRVGAIEGNYARALDRVSQGIPQAPFKTTWPALVIKRAIRWAVDNGYSSVAWTTGKQQARRYNLSQDVGSFEASREGDRYALRFMSVTVAQTIANQDLGLWDNDRSVLMTEDDMRQAFGASVTARVVSGAKPGAPIRLEGSDLEVGGEGMRAFYDRNLVNIANGVIKKYGAKVGAVDLQLEETPRADQMLADAATARRDADALAAVDSRRAERLYADANAAEETARAMKAGAMSKQWAFDITPKMADAARAGFSLFQGGETKARGRIDFGSDGRAMIRLFEGRDLSTLLHEGAHLWIEELRADAARPDAPQWVKDDWKAVRVWFRANGHRVSNSGDIPVEAHEMWARGMERYFLEGKAPTSALQRAFSSFRSWLLRIYKVVANLNTPLTDEVREVMGRLLATQEAIDAVAAEDESVLLFKTAEEAGATQAEFDALKASAETVRSEAFDALLYRTMEVLRKERTREWKHQQDGVRREVTAEVDARPEFRALAILRGRGVPRLQLSRQAFVDAFGTDLLAQMPRGVPPLVVDQGGVDPELVAEMSGFRSAREMVDMLIGLEARQRELRAEGSSKSVRAETIDIGTQSVMRDRFGDPLGDGSLEEEALAAIKSDKASELIAAEIRLLSRRNTLTTGLGDQVPTSISLARELAERIVREGKVSEQASAAAIQRHSRNEQRAARAAEEAMLAGDRDTAFRQKQAQLYHRELWRASKRAKDQTDVIVRRMARYAKMTKGAIDPEYLDRIHDLLEAYDFRQRTARERAERVSFSAWVASKEKDGEEVYVPPRLRDAERVNFKDLTVEDLIGLDDTVTSVAHLGRRKGELLAAREAAKLEDLVDEFVSNAASLPDRKFTADRNEKRSLSSVARGLNGGLVVPEFILDKLDANNPNGVMNRLLVQGSTDAANEKERLVKQVLQPIADLFNAMPREQRLRMRRKVTTPELMNRNPSTGQEVPTTFEFSEIISIALNTGNSSNYMKLLRGESLALSESNAWTDAKVQAVLEREMTEADWDFVQVIWRRVDSLWPEIVRAEREITGVKPEKVEPRVVQTKFGAINGGYYPVVYDPNRSAMAERNYEDDATRMMGQMGRTIATPKGHTITRTEAAAPLLLSLEGVLLNHVNRTTTRIAYGRFIRDALKFLSQPKVIETINVKLGPEYRKTLRGWLGRQVGDAAFNTAELAEFDRLLRHFRISATMVGLGLRLTTMLAQTAGLANSVARLGPTAVARGLASMASHVRRGDLISFVSERSPEMAGRVESFDRDVRAFFSEVQARDSKLDKVRTLAFLGIGNVQYFVVDLPTWLGAYEKALRDGMTETEAVAFGDKTVRKSQSAGREKDLAAMRGGSEFQRIMTMFYSYWSVFYSTQWETVQLAKEGDYRRAGQTALWVMMAGPVLGALLTGDWPDEEDEEGWFEWAMRKMFFGLWMGVPGVREVAGGLERLAKGERPFPSEPPLNRAFGALVKPGSDLVKVAEGGEPSDRWVQNVITAPGYFLNLPTGQLGASAQYGYDVATGAAVPEDAGDVFTGISKGRQRPPAPVPADVNP